MRENREVWTMFATGFAGRPAITPAQCAVFADQLLAEYEKRAIEADERRERTLETK